MTESVEDVTWVAGLLEGEGCFSNSKTSPLINLAMTDEDVVRKAQSILGGFVRTVKGRLTGKQMFELRIHGYKAIKIMKTIRPYMGLRRGQKIDDLISEYESVLRSENGKCKRGHDLTNRDNYWINNTNGSKVCKLCSKISKFRVAS